MKNYLIRFSQFNGDSEQPSQTRSPKTSIALLEPKLHASTGSNPQTQSLSTSSGPGSPLAPNPLLASRFQPHHSPWGNLTPQGHFSSRPYDGPPALYSNLNAYRPTRLQLEHVGLVPRVAHTWRLFLQASPHF